ncbi:DUF4013 domain-containing protein [Collinsella tanakaei]|uniref:DUF4013 domain-containing protein n=1 Tax=Collinsella tanakaei TaxID=626935 RepID=UPI0025A3AB0E|nr:DUF4013 domain-containing protein [Collinsella tanakaei]MDM8299541.1 DUF4013 domain-containing protein [Collinsella tanakaei]
MYAQQLGFTTSWKMLTRDKGWIKPVLVLALVGWIPVLGQIAILGYGLEWARLTAWGVDAAPKQRGVDYGKVLTTGGIAFLISLTLGLALALVNLLITGGWYSAALFPAAVSLFTGSLVDVARESSVFTALIMLVLDSFMGTFTAAAMMRATLYDGFSAGWRLDRLFQMVARDPQGFLHLYLISLIGSLVNAAYSLFATALGSVAVFGGVMGLAMGAHASSNEVVSRLLMGVGPGIVVVGVIVFLAIAFAGAVISTAVQLVFLNAAGQWFCRFEVNRWGVSSAPLPEGVPQRSTYVAGQAPTPPAAAPATGVAPTAAPTAGTAPATGPAVGATPAAGSAAGATSATAPATGAASAAGSATGAAPAERSAGGATPATAPVSEAAPAAATPGDEPAAPMQPGNADAPEADVPASAGEVSSGASSEDAEAEAPADVPSAEHDEEESEQEEKPASSEV